MIGPDDLIVPVSGQVTRRRIALHSLLAAAAFALVFIIYCLLANRLRGGLDFNDETEKLVAAEMIARGGRMYRDVYSQHGPFAFMLAHLSRLIWGGSDVAQYRWLPFLMGCGTAATLLVTPAVSALHRRLWAATAFLLGVTACQTIWSLMMGMYQVFAGHLFAWALCLLVLPLLLDRPPRRALALVGGAALGFALCCAYSFLPAVGFLFLACGLHAYAKGKGGQPARIWFAWGCLGGLTALAIMSIWLAVYGDLQGYLAYHLYLNQFIYKDYVAHDLLLILKLLVPVYNYAVIAAEYRAYGRDMPYNDLLACLLLSALAIGALLFAKGTQAAYGKKPWLIALLGLGLLYTDPRGSTVFQAATLVIVTLSFLPLAAVCLYERQAPGRRPLAGMLGILSIALAGAQIFAVTYCYFLSPVGYYAQRGSLGRAESAEMAFVRQLVAPDETVEALPFHPLFYLQADRWPASGYFYALPWQLDYANAPILGHRIDLCADLAARRPKFIFYDGDAVWGHSADSYMPCVTDFITQNYLRSFRFKGGWVRADLVADNSTLQDSSLIPSDRDWLSLSVAQSAALQAATTRLARLQVVGTDRCLTASAAGEPAQTGPCAGAALQLAIPRRDKDFTLPSMPDALCLESADTAGATLRLWPCMDSDGQGFSQIATPSGFRLQNRRSGLCLGEAAGRVVSQACAFASLWRWDGANGQQRTDRD